MTVFSSSNKLYVPVRYMTCVSHAVYFGQLHNAQSQGSVFFSYAQYSVLESVEMVQLFCSKFPNQQSVNNQYLSTVLLRKGNSSGFTRERQMSFS